MSSTTSPEACGGPAYTPTPWTNPIPPSLPPAAAHLASPGPLYHVPAAFPGSCSAVPLSPTSWHRHCNASVHLQASHSGLSGPPEGTPTLPQSTVTVTFWGFGVNLHDPVTLDSSRLQSWHLKEDLSRPDTSQDSLAPAVRLGSRR